MATTQTLTPTDHILRQHMILSNAAERLQAMANELMHNVCPDNADWADVAERAAVVANVAELLDAMDEQ